MGGINDIPRKAGSPDAYNKQMANQNGWNYQQPIQLWAGRPSKPQIK